MADPFALYNKQKQEKVLRSNSFVKEDLFVSQRVKGRVFDMKTYNKRLSLFFVLIFVSSAIIIFKLLYLQVAYGQYYLNVAEGNRIRIHHIASPRGLIYDRNGAILAENTFNFIVSVIPVDLPKENQKLKDLAAQIADVAKMDAKDVLEIIDKADRYSYQPLPIKDNLTYDQAIAARLLITEFPSIAINVSTRRIYHNDRAESLSHIIGYLGKINQKDLDSYEGEYQLTDYIGKTGLEYEYERMLRGVKGRQQVEVDALGRKVDTIAYEQAVPGKDLYLTLDINIQAKIEEIARAHSRVTGKKRVAVIALDPHNGEVLGMVSMPSFDNNAFAAGIGSEEFQALLSDPNQPMFNRAIQGTYPSGSTIKPVLAAAALQENIISPYANIYSTGGIVINQWYFPDWKAGGHGYTDLAKALAESVNTYFYYIGGGYKDFKGLGLDKIYVYYKAAGLGNRLGIDMPAEAAGLVPTDAWKQDTKGEGWYIGDTYHIAIGQGDLLVTPLQVANWTAMIANQGTLYQPHILKNVVDVQTARTQKNTPKILTAQFADPENIRAVQRGLRDAVLYGSAISLYDMPITIAGKTGTAQWSSEKENHAWFTSFAPYNNPEIVLTVLVEEGGEGSKFAIPIAKDFYYWWANYKTKNQ